MAFNALINLKVILLVLFALCALFLTNTQATSSSLSEFFSKCEDKFWFKDMKDFKKSIKSKCLKENHYYEKRSRKHHVCNNKSHDKKLLLSKWENFADCRCQSALVKLSDFKESKVFVCYQVAALNKATGEFLGKLIVFKKKSEIDYDVAVKFSRKVKLLGHWDKYNKDKDLFYRLKDDKHPTHIGDTLVERHFIPGRIPKYDSMNKINVDDISPTDFILLLKNGRVRSLKENKEFVIVPFAKFVPSKNYLYEHKDKDEYNKDRNDNKEKDRNDDKEKDKPSNKPDSPTKSSADPYQSPTGTPADSNQSPTGTPADSNQSPTGTPADPYQSPAETTPSDPSQTPTDGGYGPPGGSGTEPDYGTGATEPDSTDPQSTGGTGTQDVTAPTNPTNPTTPTNAASAGQEAGGATKDTGISSAAVGSIIFGAIIAVGAAFIGYNTYERIRWRRQYRRREEAAQQNTSLANVPDYNGYGRAY